MKKYIALLLVALHITGCNSQQEQTTETDNKNDIAQNVPPKGNWKVNKEVDEYGNIIKYDSIYSYSSRGNEALPKSIIKHYQSRMSNQFSEFNSETEDEALNSLGNKMFDEEMLQQFPELKQMIKQMEAMQQQMIQTHSQPMLIAPEREENADEKEKIDS